MYWQHSRKPIAVSNIEYFYLSTLDVICDVLPDGFWLTEQAAGAWIEKIGSINNSLHDAGVHCRF